MIEGLFTDTNYLAAKKLLDMTALRHEAIASNIANIETPNYRRIDVAPSFSAELQQALAGKNPSQITSLEPHLEVDPNAVATSRDGNTVQLETELLNLQQNTMAHTLETQIVSSSLARLRMAITGRS